MTDLNIQLLRQKYNKESRQLDKKLLSVVIKNVEEPLVYLPDLAKEDQVKVVFEEKEKHSAFLRKSVAKALMEAARYFNQKGLIIKIESAYRSLESQKERFLERLKSMEKRYPGKTKKKLLELANVYTAGIPVLAAHTAGAAVDVTLSDEQGKPLDFGVPYRHGDIESATDYPDLSKKVKKNRKILKDGMEKYGFTNYPFEYWHYSKGDVYDAYLAGHKFATYSPVNYDFNKKESTPLKGKKELYKFFK